MSFKYTVDLEKGKYSDYNKEIKDIYIANNGALGGSRIAKILCEKYKERNIIHNSLRQHVQHYINVVLSKIDLDNKIVSDTSTNDYATKGFVVLSAWNKVTDKMMDIDTYCEHYNLPREDITSYKLVSHTGVPYYNIVFKENISEKVYDFDIDSIVSKHIKPLPKYNKDSVNNNDFDVLTYTDLHVGMDTNKDGNSMYPVKWNREAVMLTADAMVESLVSTKSSPVLIIDELGDLLDGFNAKTVRGGHELPQNMTNEEAFDCAVEFKERLTGQLVGHYDSIICNNICNDNHSGAFGYFVNQAFKSIAEIKYDNVEVNNHRMFINHYFVDNICFIITHGKDDSALKFGFKPNLDSQGMERIDQYCKQNEIYKKASLIVFKKGDSHQALFDMCTSDDFFYFNYPAASPSSKWIQTNFKKGRRGFVIEKYNGLKVTVEPEFL